MSRKKRENSSKTNNITGKVLSPETLLVNLYTSLTDKKLYSPSVFFFATFITCMLCYFRHMIYGLGCPDSLAEGVYYYRNANYSTSQARWMLRYINEFFGKNVVIPPVTVFLYCLMIGTSAFIICRITKVRNRLYQVILTAMMVSFPVILHHFAFMYMALAYSFSFLCVTIGTAFIRMKKIPGVLFGIVCYLMMMGSYQSYIGAISALALILFIYDLLSDEKIKNPIINFILCAFSGITACLINIPFSNWMMKIHYVGADGRVSGFSISDIFSNLGFSLKYSYIWFFSYFNNDVLSRNRFYALVLSITFILSILTAYELVRKKEILKAFLFIMSVILLPLAMNILLVIMPGNGMRDILRYQYVLIFALLIILQEYLGKYVICRLLKYPAIISVMFLFTGNIISANCTEMMYKLCYDHYEQQFTMAMSRIYDLEGYRENETRIIIGGAPSCEIIDLNNPKIFRYAEKDGGPVFWWNTYGMTVCREHYFKAFLGVNPGYVPDNEYLAIVRSRQFKDMPVWPEEGSVQMIEGFAVIKFVAEPPES